MKDELEKMKEQVLNVLIEDRGCSWIEGSKGS